MIRLLAITLLLTGCEIVHPDPQRFDWNSSDYGVKHRAQDETLARRTEK